MRKVLLCILLLQCCALALFAQTNNMSPTGESVFYYYKGQKLYFNVTYKKIVVGFVEDHSIADVKKFLTMQSKSMFADSVKATALKNQCQN